MSNDNPAAQIGPLEIIAEWEGPPIPAPGVLFDAHQAAHLSPTDDLSELIAWIAIVAFPSGPDPPAHERARAKVREVLSAWSCRFGPGKLVELQDRLFAHMQKYRDQRKITDDELHRRIQLLFKEIPGAPDAGHPLPASLADEGHSKFPAKAEISDDEAKGKKAIPPGK
jgi:hypothetical protein